MLVYQRVKFHGFSNHQPDSESSNEMGVKRQCKLFDFQRVIGHDNPTHLGKSYRLEYYNSSSTMSFHIKTF